MNHILYMQRALEISRRNLGQVWPNPAVGALVVKDGQVIAQGWTGRGGRPHAETEALKAAGNLAKGATLYITLEPCAHQSKTPPCTGAIIAAGISTCVIACRDPNPQVSGKGIEQLKSAGIEVIENVCAEEARKTHEGFFSWIEKKRPFVALKIATSLDDKITTGDAKKRWITAEPARAYGHLLRSQFDAIATGIGTVLADDPLLTCRLPGLEDRSPVRVVFDSSLHLPPNSQLAKTAKDVPVWVVTKKDVIPSEVEGSLKILRLAALAQDDSISTVLSHLAEQGITRLLVEGGQKLTTAFLNSGLVDRIYWFRAPSVIGEKGLSATLSRFETGRWQLSERIDLHPDHLDILEPCSPAS